MRGAAGLERVVRAGAAVRRLAAGHSESAQPGRKIATHENAPENERTERFDDLCGQDGRYEAFLQIGGV
jgi:hypothetical protein